LRASGGVGTATTWRGLVTARPGRKGLRRRGADLIFIAYE